MPPYPKILRYTQNDKGELLRMTGKSNSARFSGEGILRKIAAFCTND